MQDKTVLSVTEAAEYLSLNVATVRAMIHSGEIKAMRAGKVFRIKKSDLDDLFQAQTAEPENAQ